MQSLKATSGRINEDLSYIFPNKIHWITNCLSFVGYRISILKVSFEMNSPFRKEEIQRTAILRTNL